MLKPKRILLSGYYGFGNTGDEAILEAICEELRRQEPQVLLSVLMDNQERANELGLVAYPRKSLSAIWAALKNCDLLLSGGGGLIQDSTGPQSVVYYGGLITLARLARRRAVVFCQGFGPLRTVTGLFAARVLMPWASWAVTRDEDSQRELAAIARPLKVQVAADPALLLTSAPAERLEKIMANLGLSGEAGGNLVAVALRNWPGLQLSEVVGALQSFAAKMAEQGTNIKYVVLPFQASCDTELAQQVANTLGESLAAVASGLSPRELLGVISRCQLVLAMRLHAIIFAAGQQVPSVGLSYDPKVQRFCQSVAGQFLDLAHADGGSVLQALEQGWEHRAQQRQHLQQVVPSMQQAVKNAATTLLQQIS